MTVIPNFPEELLEEHKRWHDARHSVDIDNPPAGYGLEFLTFHRAFVRKALEWYRQAGLDARLVEPWPSVPEPIRRSYCYNQAAEARIVQRPDTFASADELGRYIESSGIHGCIHEMAAELYGDEEINDFDFAPRNTVFYNIHLMIDNWWRNWEGLGRFGEGMAYWSGRFCDSDGEVLYYRRDDSTWWLGNPERHSQFGRLAQLAGGRNGGDGREGGDGGADLGLYLEWGAVGESAAFGRMDDGRPFRVWDSDQDGRLEIVFQSPFTGDWWEGSLRSGRLVWSRIRLQRTGLPVQEPDLLRAASSRRKRKTLT
ncbi:hypothetical protein COLU111180_06720 [Cohnella lubricantis]